ncbi:MAG: winged helix-turn-helix domain-containing protein [Actinomycetota bacterium]|nr:winged helix-turn-helix domain-containing protein [Actinomycetota bacterium]
MKQANEEGGHLVFQIDQRGLLASSPGRLFSKHELSATCGAIRAPAPRSRALDAHVSRLRRKLAPATAEGAIENRRGTNYRLGLVEPDAAAAA